MGGASCSPVIASIGTQSFVDPDASGRIVRDLEARLSADGIRDVRELVGALVLK